MSYWEVMQNRLQRWRILLPKIPSKQDRRILAICVGLSLIAWIFTKMSQTYRLEADCTFVLSPPAGKIFNTTPPSHITVELSARGWDLMRYSLLKPPLQFTYEFKEGSERILTIEQIRSELNRRTSASNVSVVNITGYNPYMLQFEAMNTRKIPVYAVVEEDKQTNYRVSGRIQINPAYVVLSGPASLLDSLKQWPTKPISLNEVKKDFQNLIELQKPPKGLRIIPENVQITIPIEQFTEKTLHIPIHWEQLNQQYITYLPKMVKVTCWVPLSLYDNLDSDSFYFLATPIAAQNKAAIKMTKSPKNILNIRYSPQLISYYVNK